MGVSGWTRRPETSTRSWEGFTLVPMVVTAVPLTRTEPAAMSASALRREETPAWARNRCSRTWVAIRRRGRARRRGQAYRWAPPPEAGPPREGWPQSLRRRWLQKRLAPAPPGARRLPRDRLRAPASVDVAA